MKKTFDTILFYIMLIVIAFLVCGITNVFGAIVQDTNNGNKGYILINDGTTGHRGKWTNIKTIPELKGDKGDKGDTGEAGKDGIDELDGLNGKDGKDVDPTIVNNLQNEDITLQNNINSETAQRVNANTQLQNNINVVNSRVDNLDNRISQLERTQFVLETSFRILDTKRITLRPFFRQNFTRNKVDVVGLKIDVKLGQSYEEKLINKINARLDKIENTIGNAPIITQVVDNKGKIKSVNISANGLRVNGEF